MRGDAQASGSGSASSGLVRDNVRPDVGADAAMENLDDGFVNENFVKADDANLWSPEATRRHGGFNFGKEEVAGCLDQLIAENEEEERISILLSLGQIDVAEVYSPERITKRAGEFGLQNGLAMDLNEINPFTGRPWNFTDEKDRNTPRWYVTKMQPEFLIGSPPCTLFSTLQHIGGNSTDAEKFEKR